jgi:hypothetical protein
MKIKRYAEGLFTCFLMVAVAGSAFAGTLTVRSNGDAGGSCPGADCTLRQAIATAAAGDTINFSLFTYQSGSTITLTSGELLIDKSLTIRGPGAALLKVVRSGAGGTPNFRIFRTAAASLNITIAGLTISNGVPPTPGSGGGISNTAATLTVANVVISGNGTSTGIGGGIYNQGTIIITNSTISENRAIYGGGIASETGPLTLVSSTVSNNYAREGGGIFIYAPPTGYATIVSSTISGNHGNGINNSAGAGIYTPGGTGTINLRNTIVALNSDAIAPDILGAVTSQGYNLIGDTTGMTLTGSTTGNQLNVAADQLRLDLLRDNGGPTPTMALLSGSTAIEAGDSGGANTDQRGFARPVVIPNTNPIGDGSDIGAFEVQADQLPGCSTINLVVNNKNDGGADSLRSILGLACAGSTITFAASVRGTITLTNGELVINRNLTIAGPGANLLSIQRSAASSPAGIFIIGVGNFNATISGLTITNGDAPGSNGGGILNQTSGVLTVADCAISGNKGSGVSNINIITTGGAVPTFINKTGTVNVMNSTISNNTNSNGGGIFNLGTLNVTNTTISGNQATASSSGGSGGGIYCTSLNGTGGQVTITNSTLTNNTTGLGTGNGGGIASGGGVVSVRNSIIAMNTSTDGPDVSGGLTSQGFNLIGTNAGATITPVQTTDIIGFPGSTVDPQLGPLQNNGGPTETHALLSGSRAIDKGESSGSAGDQRYFSRPVDLPGVSNASGGDGSDIGAFEVQLLLATLDIDGSVTATKYDALTDGILALRYMFGLTGSSLTAGAVGSTATRTDAIAIKAFLDANRSTFDIDGDGNVDALTDGLLIVRYLFGLRGSSLIQGAFSATAPRNTSALIESYLATLTP